MASGDEVYRAISRTLHDYCRFVDEGRAEDFAALYTHDGVHDDGRSQRIGREQIKKLVEGVISRYQSTSHHASNIDIELIDDTHATAWSYIYAWHRAENAPDLEVWGRYADQLCLEEGRWRIAKRELHVAGIRGLDVDPGFRRLKRANT
jgi:uncharacterized protein (TIGR02246 family)